MPLIFLCRMMASYGNTEQMEMSEMDDHLPSRPIPSSLQRSNRWMNASTVVISESEMPPRPGHLGRHSGRRPSLHAARHIPRLPTRASQPIRRQSERFQSLPTIRNNAMQWPNTPTTRVLPFNDEQFLRRYKLATYMAVFAIASASILFIFMIAVSFYIMAKMKD